MKSLRIYYQSSSEKTQINYSNKTPIELLSRHAEEMIKYNEDISTVAIFDENNLKGTFSRLIKTNQK